jgi:hypothetical protein
LKALACGRLADAIEQEGGERLSRDIPATGFRERFLECDFHQVAVEGLQDWNRVCQHNGARQA